MYYGKYKVIPIRTEIIRFCETLGMDYMRAIIWQKTTIMNTSGGGAIMGSYPYPRNGILKMDYKFILILKKLGNAPKPTKQQKEQSIIIKEEWNQYFSSHWNFNGIKQMGHIAMFPEELPKRLIKCFLLWEKLYLIRLPVVARHLLLQRILEETLSVLKLTKILNPSFVRNWE